MRQTITALKRVSSEFLSPASTAPARGPQAAVGTMPRGAEAECPCDGPIRGTGI